MLNLFDTDPQPVNKLARAMNKDVSTLYRWGSPRGVRGHRLRLTRIGGRTYVYHADWEAFEKALNGDQEPEALNPALVKRQGDDLTDTELDAAGF